MYNLTGKDILDGAQFTRGELEYIMDVAEDMRERLRDERSLDLMRGYVLATLFFEPSTRTRLSFETAMHRLGGAVVGFASATTSSVAKGESLADTVRTVDQYADLIVIRHPRIGSAREAGIARQIAERSETLPLGVELTVFDEARDSRAEAQGREPHDRPALILWNHRWEYDKNPEGFFHALFDLAEGEHIVRVKAMDSNLVEDPTPAELIFSVSPRKVGEPEPNDSPDLAVQLPLGVEMFGVTASWKEDPDWFEITLPQNATALTLTFKRPGGDGSTEVAVLSETGETLTAFRAEPSTGQKGYATLGVRPGSKVYVKVSPSNVTRGFAYILTADYIPSSSSGIWEVEGGTAEVKLSGGKLILMGLKDLDSDDEDLIRLRADVRSPKLLSIKLSRLKTAQNFWESLHRYHIILD